MIVEQYLQMVTYIPIVIANLYSVEPQLKNNLLNFPVRSITSSVTIHLLRTRPFVVYFQPAQTHFLVIPLGMSSRIRVRHHENYSQIADTDDAAAPPGYVNIAYRVVGQGPEKLVMIPGMCVSYDMWRHQVAHLRTDPSYSILLLDNRGAGESSDVNGAHDDRLNGYTMDAMARDVWAVVDVAFGRHSHVHFIGHSMGSMVAQRAALIPTHGHRIASLTLLCGHDGGWFWNSAPSAALVRAMIEVMAARFDPNVSANVYLRLHFTREFLDGYTVCAETGQKLRRKDVFRSRYVDGVTLDTNADAVSEARETFWHHLAAARTHSLSAQDATVLRERPYPKLVVYGREDAVVLPRASRQLAGRIGARTVGVHAAHFAMEEAAAEINRLLVLHTGQASLLRNAAIASTNGICKFLLKQSSSASSSSSSPARATSYKESS